MLPAQLVGNHVSQITQKRDAKNRSPHNFTDLWVIVSLSKGEKFFHALPKSFAINPQPLIPAKMISMPADTIAPINMTGCVR